jgi:hypothetical protein
LLAGVVLPDDQFLFLLVEFCHFSAQVGLQLFLGLFRQ